MTEETVVVNDAYMLEFVRTNAEVGRLAVIYNNIRDKAPKKSAYYVTIADFKAWQEAVSEHKKLEDEAYTKWGAAQQRLEEMRWNIVHQLGTQLRYKIEVGGKMFLIWYDSTQYCIKEETV